MNWSIILNFLLVGAVIIDRIYRLKSIKEFREAKEAVIAAKDATVESLKMQLEASEKNNDIAITEMHKRRVESIKLVVDDQEKIIEELKVKLENSPKNNPELANVTKQLLELAIKYNLSTKETLWKTTTDHFHTNTRSSIDDGTFVPDSLMHFSEQYQKGIKRAKRGE